MSDDTKNVDVFVEQLQKDALKEIKKDEVLGKELIIRERRADLVLQKIQQGDRDTEIAKSTDYGTMTPDDVREKQKENTEYMLAARNKIPFINKEFDKAVPFFRKNLILIGGKTGEGKSTTVANIILEMIRQTNKNTGKRRRILVLTNEERAEDVYNRITCLIKGWHYTNHDKFTDDKVAIFNEYIEKLSSGGMVTVVDDTHHGASGTTSTLEGICQVFDNLIANKEYYDAILIDYYQNIKESRTNAMLKDWEVQAALVRKLDQYKNVYPAPIVVLAQVTPPDAENRTPFKVRIEGRKAILNVATCAMEMIAHREELCTEWIVHKSRFNEMVGMGIETGYDKGRYVEYSDDFKDKINKMKAARANTELNKSIGHMPLVKEEDDE